MFISTLRRAFIARPMRRRAWIGTVVLALAPAALLAEPSNPRSIVFKLDNANERMEMRVKTSRILTLDRPIPTAQVNDPDVLDIQPLGPDRIQIVAKKPGVTAVSLQDDDDEWHTVDVIVFADAQELQMTLQSLFPRAAIKVTPLQTGVALNGYVDDPVLVQRIQEVALQYYPTVLNNITVGGVQQVLLEVRVMEVSRTKLRNCGFDWGNITKRGDFVAQSVGGLIKSTGNSTFGGAVTTPGAASALMTNGSPNFTFGIVSPGNSFFGVLDLLQQQNVAKVLAEPKLVTVSGRPASFNDGGEFPILVPQSLGTVSIQYKRFGTQVEFVPIVLGNGNIRLEVRPRVSEIDPSLNVVINGTTVPGLRSRDADTAAEMRAGQTLAIAGLVQFRSTNQKRGILWLADLPVVGVAFRNLQTTINEIELLIMVTPQLVEGMDPCEVPPIAPGWSTAEPSDSELVIRGHIEVPACDPNGIMGPYAPGTPGAPGAAGPRRPWSDQLPPGAVEVVPSPDDDSSSTAPAPQDGARRRARPARGEAPDRGLSSRRGSQPPVRASAAPQRSVASSEMPQRTAWTQDAPMRTAGVRPSNRKNSSNPSTTGGRTGNPTRKSLPGFIGPTGNDLR
jgi:pilus assembly protein CpaC